jgi:hypothetical protein
MPEGDPAGVRQARLLLLAFAAFVVYGSFFPFSFQVDAAEVQRGTWPGSGRPSCSSTLAAGACSRSWIWEAMCCSVPQ